MGAHLGIKRNGGVEEPAQELHAGGVVPHVACDDPCWPDDALRLRQCRAEIRNEVEDEAGHDGVDRGVAATGCIGGADTERDARVGDRLPGMGHERLRRIDANHGCGRCGRGSSE